MTSDPRFRDTEPLSRLDPSTFRSDHFHVVHGTARPVYVPQHRRPVTARRPWYKRLLRRS